MNQMKRLSKLVIVILVIILTGCTTDVYTNADTSAPPTNTPVPPTDTPALPTEEFIRRIGFGDGYAAHIPISEVEQKSQEEIVNILVTQWLEHYHTESTQADMMIKAYKIDEVIITSDDEDISPFIIASVQFSVIPESSWFGAHIYTGEPPWWHLCLTFGVHGKVTGPYYWLRTISAGG